MNTWVLDLRLLIDYSKGKSVKPIPISFRLKNGSDKNV